MKQIFKKLKKAAAITCSVLMLTELGLPVEYSLTMEAEAASSKEITGFGDFDYEKNTLVLNYNDRPDLATLTAMMPDTIAVYFGLEQKTKSIPVTWECVGADYETEVDYYYQFSPVISSGYTVSEEIDWYVDAPYVAVHLVTAEEGKISILKEADVCLALGTDLSTSVYKAASGTSSYSPVSTTAPEEEQEIFEYLSECSGYNTAVICGIMANLYHESAFLSNNLQNSYENKTWNDVTYTKAVDNGTYRYRSYTTARSSFRNDSKGYGLCQWTAAVRKEGLYDAAKADKVSIANMEMQLEYMLSEVSSTLKSKLKACANTADGAYKAGYYWCYYFEAPARRNSASKARGNLAKNSFFPRYKQYVVTSSADYSTGYYRVTEDTANVRSSSTLSSSMLGAATKGELFKVTEVKNGYGKITFNGSTAWLPLKRCEYIKSIFYVAFDANGGSGSMDKMTAAYGYNNYLTDCSFERDGYRFTGWYAYRQSDGKWYTEAGWKTEAQIRQNGYTKYLYTDGKNVSKTTSVDGDTIVMYAQWKKLIRFTLEFDANGGSGTMTSQVCVYGDSNVIKASTFTNTGYHVAGWYAWRESDGKWYTKDGWKTEEEIAENDYQLSPYKDKCTISKTSSVDGDTIIMYAQWDINTFTVKYDKNDSQATGSMSSTMVTYGVGEKLRANTFKKTGYHFTGWHAYRASDNKCLTTSGWKTESEIKSGGYTKYNYSNQATLSKTTAVHKDVVTMYAQWTVNTFTVEFNANGGSGTMNSVKVTYGVSKTLPANTFTRSGYTFAGWNVYRKSDNKWYTDGGWKTSEEISSGGYTKTAYSDGASIAKTSAVNNDTIVMYAAWKKK